MPLDDRKFAQAVERAVRALSEGNLRTYRDAMSVISTRGSDEQWERALRRLRAPDRGGRANPGPGGAPHGMLAAPSARRS